MDYVTVATTGNALDFGDLYLATNHNASAESKTRGLSINGANPSFFAQQQCIDQGTNVVVPSGLTSRVADLSAGDTVNLMVYHNEGTSEVTEPNRTFFGGYRLSAHP